VPTRPPAGDPGQASPRGALAFKFTAEEIDTILADVLWDVGKTGKIAPVAPPLTGVTSAGQQSPRYPGQPGGDPRPRHQIGDTVLVRRAGDVDPVRRGCLDPPETHRRGADIVPPSQCQSCGSR